MTRRALVRTLYKTFNCPGLDLRVLLHGRLNASRLTHHAGGHSYPVKMINFVSMLLEWTVKLTQNLGIPIDSL